MGQKGKKSLKPIFKDSTINISQKMGLSIKSPKIVFGEIQFDQNQSQPTIPIILRYSLSAVNKKMSRKNINIRFLRKNWQKRRKVVDRGKLIVDSPAGRR
jgi:hypothetical protein